MASNVSLTRNARLLFYFVTPDEFYYKTVQDVPDFFSEASPFIISMAILELIVAPWLGCERLRVNDATFSVISLIFERITRLVIGSFEIVIYSWIFNNFRIITLPCDSHFAWWLGVLCIDLGYYWFHRCFHEINILWCFHQVHHSSEDLNITTSFRKSIFQFHFLWIFYIPVAVVVPPPVFFLHVQLNLLSQVWTHTELVDSLGPLDLFITSPSHHRVHHAKNAYCIHKNYGGFLIIWDRLFGTFQSEKAEKLVYGVSEPLNTWDPLYIQFFMLWKTWQRCKSTSGLGNKLGVLFKGPFWTPESPWNGYEDSVPEVKQPVQKYDKTMSRKRQCYALVHILIVFACYKEALLKESTLEKVYLVGLLMFFLMTAVSVASLYESRPYASILEFARCLAFIILDLILTGYDYDMQVIPSRLISVVRGFFILSAFTWMFVSWNDFCDNIRRDQ